MTDEKQSLEAFAEDEPLPSIYSANEELPGEAEGLEASAIAEGEFSEEELTDDEKRRRLIEELDALIERLKAINPDYRPPAFSPQRMIELIQRNMGRFSPEMGLAILDKLRNSISQDLLDVDTWRASGTWSIIRWTTRLTCSSGAYAVSTRQMNGDLTPRSCRRYCLS